jgi:hypothetical protein
VPERVIGPPGLRVAEDLIGLRRSLELLLGLRVVLVDVRMELSREPAERSLYVGL